MLIKICGLTRAQDIEAANALVPDYIGFVFAKSRRRVTLPLARELKAKLSEKIGAVGVFVDDDVQTVAQAAVQCGLAAVQLHGGEDASFIALLRPLLPQHCGIWKAARVCTPKDIEIAQATGADRLILDAFSPDMNGGAGKVFDWHVISSVKIKKPFFLAGGISADNVRSAAALAKPDGIDLSSSVETNGVKDYEKMKNLIETVRKIN
jgi:phosphoribosylanthranilate isomerase